MTGLFEALPPQVSIERQIEAVEREIRFREFVYPKRIAAGKMKHDKAREEIVFMRAVKATLERDKALAEAVRAILDAHDSEEIGPLMSALADARKLIEGKP